MRPKSSAMLRVVKPSGASPVIRLHLPNVQQPLALSSPGSVGHRQYCTAQHTPAARELAQLGEQDPNTAQVRGYRNLFYL